MPECQFPSLGEFASPLPHSGAAPSLLSQMRAALYWESGVVETAQHSDWTKPYSLGFLNRCLELMFV